MLVLIKKNPRIQVYRCSRLPVMSRKQTYYIDPIFESLMGIFAF